MDNKISLHLGHTPNYATVHIGGLSLHFSYSTLIALDTPDARYVRTNDWGPTTGKHLNYIDGGSKEAKAKRLSSAEFDQVTGDVLEDYGFRI